MSILGYSETPFFVVDRLINFNYLQPKLFFVFLLLILAISMFSARIYGAETIEITDQQIDRDLLQTEGILAVEIEVENFAPAAREIWLGYSFRTPDGSWHDIPARSLHVEAESSQKAAISEEVLVRDGAEEGNYLFVAAIWDKPPDDEATRLSSSRKRKTIYSDSDGELKQEAARPEEDLALEFSGYDFYKATHRLGRGRLRPQNVKLEDDLIKISSPPASFQGGEIRTRKLFGYGSYQLKLKTDYAPGSFSAFFLYEDVKQGNDEIDIEIYNDGSRQIDFVTFVEGDKTNYKSAELSFDPAADYHEYRIDYQPDLIEFYVEDELLASFARELPSASMKIMVNHWWPSWLEAEREHEASEIKVKKFDFQEF